MVFPVSVSVKNNGTVSLRFYLITTVKNRSRTRNLVNGTWMVKKVHTLTRYNGNQMMVLWIRLKLGRLRFDFYFFKEKISLTRTCYKAIRGSIRLSPYKWKHIGSNSRWNRNNSWKHELKSLSTSALKEDKETCSSGNNQRQDSHLSWGNNQGQRLRAYSWQSIPKDGQYIQRE